MPCPRCTDFVGIRILGLRYSKWHSRQANNAVASEQSIFSKNPNYTHTVRGFNCIRMAPLEDGHVFLCHDVPVQCSKLRPDTGQFPVKLPTCLDITHFDQPKCRINIRHERTFN